MFYDDVVLGVRLRKLTGDYFRYFVIKSKHLETVFYELNSSR